METATKKRAKQLLQDLAFNPATAHFLLESFRAWLVQGASLAFYCDDYPYARDALICVLHTLAHGRVSMDDVARFAWCASHPFLHGDKNTRAWRAGDGTA